MRIKKQTDAKDCGPLVVQALHKHYYEQWVNINELKMKVDYGTKGVNISNLIKLASKYGIEAEAYEASIDSIIESMPEEHLIGIIDSDGMNHYVIFKYSNKKFYISDSIKGENKVTIKEFERIYKGTVLTIKKSEYQPEKIDITNPMKYLANNWNLIAWIATSLILSIIFTFVSSIFMKIILDKIVPGKLSLTLTIVCLSFAFLAVLRALNKFFRAYLVKKLSLQIEKDLTYTYFTKINKVSYKEMSKITINDNLRRIGLIAHVSGFIANSFFVVFNEVAMLIVATSLLIWISPSLFAIALAAGGFLCLITVMFRTLTRTKYDDLIKNQMNMFNTMIDSVNQTKELKTPGVAKVNTSLFSKRFKFAKNTQYEIWSFNAMQSFLESVIQFAIPIVLVYIGVHGIFDNSMTIGSLLMFISVFNSFIAPIKDLCDFMLQLPQMQKNIELISFIVNLPEEQINDNGLKVKRLDSIRFKDFKVGYDRTLLEIKDWTIDSNIRLKGKNGAGKSTLLNSIATILHGEGEIYFDKFEKDYYSLDSIRENIIYISPTSYLPNISILEYITLNNQEAMKLFLSNANKYNLIGLLKSLNINLETPLINNGANLSSGQRQIVTLLRLFAFKYKLIILDEAFENIDINKLEGIKQAINDFQDSLIIEVSHSGKYITNGKVVDIEEINSYT